MKKILLINIVILFLAFSARLTAQSGDFFPYVTQVRAELRNNIIRLTWVDSPDARGSVYIFRSARPFSGSIPANIRPIVVRYGTQYYFDDVDNMENLHYFIAASDISGRRYDVIIPSMNSTNIIHGHVQPVDEIPPAVAAVGPIEGINNLTARPDGDRVIIIYNTLEPRKNAILYRSMQPIRQPYDLLNAVIVQSGFSSRFVDFPAPEITWYYAVIYEDEILSGNVNLRPGINSTNSAVIITGDRMAEQSMRSIPLPLLTIESMPSGHLTSDSKTIPMNSASEFMLRNTIMYSKPPLELKSPRVFVIDLQAPAGGEDSALFQIVKDYFEKFEWESAKASLRHYLSLPRSPDVQLRARFYFGQTLYYTGNYREALLEFLSFRSFHPVEANIWIEAVLAAMVY
ncbi:MAG: hypothetical protein LBQ93_06210 [Treponema sp.]|jgi:hypothetical protein|nr:hypothetical protein [Treponema sp.]